ncbi:MAG TPA: polysaccharide deacetylase family protein [Candidatus Sulfotelmatobacter sp.]|nr:polysaccharide deacetylase family protein [Candidatus Sulfotelmatobacter sp.]
MRERKPRQISGPPSGPPRPPGPARTWKEFRSHSPRLERLRSRFHFLRKPFTLVRSFSLRPERDAGWIRFLLYHFVFDDQRKNFEQHLVEVKRHGQFISYGDAVSLLNSPRPIEDRYFCMSFDDAFKNCFANALPILAAAQVPCIFFLPVNYLGSCLTSFPNPFAYKSPIEFMAWEDCRQLLRAGMQIGSHTLTHHSLSQLDADRARAELELSKKRIEAELGCRCEHFAAPRGKPGVHFSLDRDPGIARELGYRSFATAEPGAMRAQDSAYRIRRISVHPGLDRFELRASVLGAA